MVIYYTDRDINGYFVTRFVNTCYNPHLSLRVLQHCAIEEWLTHLIWQFHLKLGVWCHQTVPSMSYLLYKEILKCKIFHIKHHFTSNENISLSVLQYSSCFINFKVEFESCITEYFETTSCNWFFNFLSTEILNIAKSKTNIDHSYSDSAKSF